MYRTGRVQYKGYSGLSDRSVTSTCDLGGGGGVTVGQGPVIVLHLHYFLPHTKLDLFKRITTVEKKGKIRILYL